MLAACAQVSARRKLEMKRTKSQKLTNEFYAQHLSIRSLPVTTFGEGKPPKWPLPITSINEDKLLKILGLPESERSEIEGLMSVRVVGGFGLTEEQLASQAIARLAANPPQDVGVMQKRTTRWLVRPYPLGFASASLEP